MNAYYTHQQYLIEYLDKMDYSKEILCLEFGTGDCDIIGMCDLYPPTLILKNKEL